MKEIIGKGTGTGKVIRKGAAKPDDPVFKEGWTVTMWPGSWQQPPEPSDSTPGVTSVPQVPRHLTPEEQKEDEQCAARRYSRRGTNMPQQSRPKLSEPSDSTPNEVDAEADESED